MGFDFLYGNIEPSSYWTEACKVAFKIGNLEVAWYGIFIMIGFICSIALILIKLKFWYKIPIDPFYYFCLMGIPTAIIGARLWSCCIGDASWNNFFYFKSGGLAIEGGVVLTILLGLWWFPFILKKPKYCIRDTLTSESKQCVRQISMWVYFDAIVPCILVGQIIGRWGNYFNQELYGSTIDPNNTGYLEFLAKYLPYMFIKDDGYTAHQPLFLYEGLLNLLGLLILYVGVEFIPYKKAGTIGLGYIFWYGIVRISLEGLRDQKYSFQLTYIMTWMWIIISVVLIILNETKIIPKTRKYRCKYFIWENIKYFFNNQYYKMRLFMLNKYTKDNLENKNIQKQKLYEYIKDKKANNDKQHIENKKKYVRKEEEYLYYYGR